MKKNLFLRCDVDGMGCGGGGTQGKYQLFGESFMHLICSY